MGEEEADKQVKYCQNADESNYEGVPSSGLYGDMHNQIKTIYERADTK